MKISQLRVNNIEHPLGFQVEPLSFSWKVKGFYDGDGTYKVRFLPQKTGTYMWKVSGAVSG